MAWCSGAWVIFATMYEIGPPELTTRTLVFFPAVAWTVSNASLTRARYSSHVSGNGPLNSPFCQAMSAFFNVR